ncbi:ER membrane protein complex subunit 8/9 family protein [Rhodotorula paludigena]|uniref:ER membrane protein complex subunit 8/9 family protein n=1 Tax=Rhodotorula paludigena TaxID=86838 RepID=UPI00317166F4
MPYSLAPLAYLKIVLHAAKYPASTCVGLLLGTVDDKSTGQCTVSDAIPLLHHWTDLSPAMEAGLQLADVFAKQQQVVFLGVYVANERLGDLGVPHSVQKVADAIRSQRPEALVLVVDNEKLATNEPAIIPHLPSSSKSSTSWQPASLASAKLTLSDTSAPQKALEQVRAGRHAALGDFDEHLEDVRVDWLRNAGVSL